MRVTSTTVQLLTAKHTNKDTKFTTNSCHQTLLIRAAYRRIPTPKGMKKKVMFFRKKLALSSMADSFMKPESSKKSISSMLKTLPGKAKGNTEEIRSPRIQTPNNRPSWISIFIEVYDTLLE